MTVDHCHELAPLPHLVGPTLFPFLGRCEGRVDEALFPVKTTGCIELPQQRTADPLPRALDSAGRATR